MVWPFSRRPNGFRGRISGLKTKSKIGTRNLPAVTGCRLADRQRNRQRLPVGAAGTGTGSPAGRVGSTGHRPPVAARVASHGTGRTATGCGHGHRTRPDTADTDGHGHGTPATVKTWRSAGRVAAVCEQKSRQPVREAGKGKRPAVKRGRWVGLDLLHSHIGVWLASRQRCRTI